MWKPGSTPSWRSARRAPSASSLRDRHPDDLVRTRRRDAPDQGELLPLLDEPHHLLGWSPRSAAAGEGAGIGRRGSRSSRRPAAPTAPAGPACRRGGPRADGPRRPGWRRRARGRCRRGRPRPPTGSSSRPARPPPDRSVSVPSSGGIGGSQNGAEAGSRSRTMPAGDRGGSSRRQARGCPRPPRR